MLAVKNIDTAVYWGWREAFAEVLDPRYYTLAYLDSEVFSGRAQFWGGDKAALVTQFKFFPTGARDIHVLIAAGDMAEIITDLAPLAEEYGRRNGAFAATVESREGWVKALKPYGYKLHQTTVRKEL